MVYTLKQKVIFLYSDCNEGRHTSLQTIELNPVKVLHFPPIFCYLYLYLHLYHLYLYLYLYIHFMTPSNNKSELSKNLTLSNWINRESSCEPKKNSLNKL